VGYWACCSVGPSAGTWPASIGFKIHRLSLRPVRAKWGRREGETRTQNEILGLQGSKRRLQWKAIGTASEERPNRPWPWARLTARAPHRLCRRQRHPPPDVAGAGRGAARLDNWPQQEVLRRLSRLPQLQGGVGRRVGRAGFTSDRSVGAVGWGCRKDGAPTQERQGGKGARRQGASWAGHDAEPSRQSALTSSSNRCEGCKAQGRVVHGGTRTNAAGWAVQGGRVGPNNQAPNPPALTRARSQAQVIGNGRAGQVKR
jgi:hypothetical protein